MRLPSGNAKTRVSLPPDPSSQCKSTTSTHRFKLHVDGALIRTTTTSISPVYHICGPGHSVPPHAQSGAGYKHGSPNYRRYRLCGPMLQPTKRLHTSTRLFSTSTTTPPRGLTVMHYQQLFYDGYLRNSSRMSDGARTECGSWVWPLKRMSGQLSRAGKSRKEGCKGC